MKKQSVHYDISIRGTVKELKEFEKFLTEKRITVEDMNEWDEINNKENAPSGIILWSKFKYLKFCKTLIRRKEKE